MIEILVAKVIKIIKTEHQELQEMGLHCMRGLVEKFGEKLVNPALETLCIYLEKASENNQIVGISKLLMHMATAGSYRLLMEVRSKFIEICDPLLVHEVEEIR